MRRGRFLLLLAGDGIREDVAGIAELIKRNATLGFAFGLVEVALYGMPDGALLVQPRVVAKTQIIGRPVVVVQDGVQAARLDPDDAEAAVPQVVATQAEAAGGESPRQAAYRRWWQPVLDASLDDPDQEPPKPYWPNHVRAALPWKDAWILCYALDGGRGRLRVCTAGRMGADQEMLDRIKPSLNELIAALPAGTEYRPFRSGGGMTLICARDGSQFSGDDGRRAWLTQTLNAFVNVFRPAIKRVSTVE